MTTTHANDVRHNDAEQRFEATVEGHLNVAEYVMNNGVLVMTHTAVHPDVEGRGVAAALVETALRFARDEGLRVDPACAYVKGYLERHPEWADLHV